MSTWVRIKRGVRLETGEAAAAGEVVAVSKAFAAQLIAMQKAEPSTAPKKRRVQRGDSAGE